MYEEPFEESFDVEETQPMNTANDTFIPTSDDAHVLGEDIDIDILPQTSEAPASVGIETNENSRFIDYSFATPYESFIAEIDEVLRCWHEAENESLSPAPDSLFKELEYNGSMYCLLLHSSDRLLMANSKPEDADRNRMIAASKELAQSFDLNNFAVFTGAISTGSGSGLDKLMQSALYMALDSSGFAHPCVYYAGASVAMATSSPSQMTTAGYSILPVRAPSEGGGMDTYLYCNVVSHFSTDLYCNVCPALINSGSPATGAPSASGASANTNTDLYYFDGLFGLFKEKLYQYSDRHVQLANSDTGEITSPYTVKIVETYCYDMNSTANSGNNYFKRLLLQHHSHDLDQGQFTEPAVESEVQVQGSTGTFAEAPTALTGSGKSSSVYQRGLQDYMSRYLKPLIANTRRLFVNNTAVGRSSRRFGWVKDITVTLEYNSTSSGASGLVVDNEYYTNLLPSKQPPSSWGVDAAFHASATNIVTQEASSYVTDKNPRNSAISMFGANIRKLFALYVYGKTTTADGKVQSRGVNLETIRMLVSDLSTETKETVLNQCGAMQAVLSVANSEKVGATASALNYSAMPLHADDQGIVRQSIGNMFDHFSGVVGGGRKVGASIKEPKDINLAEAFHRQLSDEVAEFASKNGSTATLLPLYHWLSLSSVYISNCHHINSMLSCWYSSVVNANLRNQYWENKVTLPNFPATSGVIGGPGKIEPSLGELLGVVGDAPVDGFGYAQALLWDDLLEKHAAEGGSSAYLPFCLPDQSQSILCQKLQLLQCCIVLHQESASAGPIGAHCGPVSAADSSSFATAPASADGSDDDEFKDSSEAPPVVGPRLMRRVPPTSDSAANTIDYLRQHAKVPPAVDSHIECSVKYPQVLSDIQQFKLVNPLATVEEFVQWYQHGGGVADDATSSPEFDRAMEALVKLQWERVGAAEVPSKPAPLFKAEQEAEKVLNYLESVVTPVHLSAEFLTHTMVHAFIVLNLQFFHHFDTYFDPAVAHPSKANQTPTKILGVSIEQDPQIHHSLQLLSEYIVEAVVLLRPEGRVTQGGCGYAESPGEVLSSRVCYLLDNISNMFDLLVGYLDKYEEVKELLPNSPRMGYLLSHPLNARAAAGEGAKSGVRATSTTEASDLNLLARVIAMENNKNSAVASGASTGGIAAASSRDRSASSVGLISQQQYTPSSSNWWYSANGREIDFPNTRSVSISVPCTDSYLLPVDAGSMKSDGHYAHMNLFRGASTSSEEMKAGCSEDPNVVVFHTIKGVHCSDCSPGGLAGWLDTDEDDTLASILSSNTMQIFFKYSEIEE